METGLGGKVALVTGASKGIGQAIAAALAREGASVMLSSRKIDALEEAASTIDGDTAVFAANAGDPEAAEACVEATIERFGGIDVLVNNAATNPYMGRSIDIDVERWQKTFEVNLRGPLLWTHHAWHRSMSERPGSSVINVASIGGLSGGSAIGIYNNTKAALMHLTRVLAGELAPSTRVNAIAPGLVKTDMARALWEPNEAQLGKATPLGRIGEPDDIANAAVFLAGDMSSWMTGQTVVVDGGSTIGGRSG
jgi:NAD(P)-dependent dehydrogenase (short-subunit alcohol dehydrogenase family)